MPPVIASLTNRLFDAVRAGRSARLGVLLLHLAALAILLATEDNIVSQMAFALAWGLLNCLWLVLLLRPALAGALSLVSIVTLILLSQLKHSVLFMTVNFVDLMIIDWDTIGFLLTVMPGLGRNLLIALAVTLPAMVACWWLDPLRVRRLTAAAGFAGCLAGLSALSVVVPSNPEYEFYSGQYVSKFARSGVTAVGDYLVRGFFDSDARIVAHLNPAPEATCRPQRKPPHIVMVFDESSFDATNLPGTRVAPGYRHHFASFDGKNRALVVEGAGGPSWFTEYNVLTGLSVRSYGRFADFVTRIAAGRVERGLPWLLRRCGYKTYSFYSFLGAFLSARRFQETAGIENFYDSRRLGATGVEPDRFFYDAAARVIADNKDRIPLFLFVYTIANHFPWDFQFRPEFTPEWRGYGNGAEVDEYLRRQMLSARDYASFMRRLREEFPAESFLIVRFGDHLPGLALPLLEPTLDQAGIAQLVKARDPRFFTTYYAIDAVNYRPADMSLALPRLDAPYLPLVVMEAAGLTLDPSFAEQKRIMERCLGQFYQCGGGAEARRFNRMLIEAGLIKGL